MNYLEEEKWFGQMAEELRGWLDQQTITQDNIGGMQRQLFVPWDSTWNGLVRYETEARSK